MGAKQGIMGKKVSKKKCDAAKRASEQGANNQNGRRNSTAKAQGKQETAREESEQAPQYDETKVVLFWCKACTYDKRIIG